MKSPTAKKIKLDEIAVRQIRKEYFEGLNSGVAFGANLINVASKHGVSQGTIRNIIKCHQWQWVK